MKMNLFVTITFFILFTFEIDITYAQIKKSPNVSIDYNQKTVLLVESIDATLFPLKECINVLGSSNALLTSPTAGEPNDIGLTSILAPASYTNPGQLIIPQVTLQKYSTSAQRNFQLKYKIGNGAENTLNIPSLASGATINVSFPSWNAVLGSNVFSFYLDLPGDANLANDTMIVTCNVDNYKTYYAYNSYGTGVAIGPVKILYPTGVITSIGPPLSTPNSFLSGSDFIVSPTSKVWWGAEYSSTNNSNIYNIDTITGAFTPVGAGCGKNLTALTYNPKNDTLYGISYLSGASYLCTINRTTGIASIKGTGSTAGLIISIACSPGGTLFGINVSDEKLYTINKNTGTGTVVCSLGSGISYSQCMTFNRNEKILVTAVEAPVGSIGTLDTITGVFSQVVTTPNVSLCGLAFPYDYIPYVGTDDYFKHSNAISVFPNPAENVINIIAGTDLQMKTINIYSISGQLIQQIIPDDYIFQLDLNKYKDGCYFIKVFSNKGCFTKKITVVH